MPRTLDTTFWSAVMIALFLLPAAGHTQEMLARLSDKEVKSLVKNISNAEKKFENSLDSTFKRSVLRGPSAELKVDTYLLDLSDAMTNLEKRFTGAYAASAEATEVLNRSSLMYGYIRQNPSLKGNRPANTSCQGSRLRLSDIARRSPAMGQQFLDPTRRMSRQPPAHILQVGIRIGPVQFG